jgi:hypothetical protein
MTARGKGKSVITAEEMVVVLTGFVSDDGVLGGAFGDGKLERGIRRLEV